MIVIGWAIFRAHDMGYFFGMLKTMFFVNGNPILNDKTIYNLLEFKYAIIICAIASLPLKDYILVKNEKTKYVLSFAVFIVAIVCMLSNSFNPFIYFRF